MPKRIYVGNLPVKIDREELERELSALGPTRVVKHNASKRAAMVETSVDPQQFVNHFDGKSVGNTVISVVINHEEQW